MYKIPIDEEKVNRSHSDLCVNLAESEDWGQTNSVQWGIKSAEESMTKVGKEGYTELNSRTSLIVAEK